MELRKLDPAVYKGRPFTARYQTSGYYAIVPVPTGFSVTYTPFPAPVQKSFDNEFFGAWLEAPAAYGAFEGDALLGFVEGSPESWNRRYRISNLCIFETAHRRSGIGRRLMEAILSEARAASARMAVLETQTCNEAAIAFYRKMGFSVIGFDLYAYSNSDPALHEVRLEMGMALDRSPDL